MASTTEVAPASLPQRLVGFYHDVAAELRKVTWPDVPQTRQLAIGVIVLSLLIGGVIALMDVAFQQLLVRWLPALVKG